MYSIDGLVKLTGVSKRTLHYYDEIHLLKPNAYTDAGYRLYDGKSIDRLQQILLYKRMGVSLKEIKMLLDDSTYNEVLALKNHLSSLYEERKRLEVLIDTVEKTITEKQGGQMISDQDKFEGLKRNLIEQNEMKYGKEIKEKYPEEVLTQSISNFKNMTKEDFERMKHLEKEIKDALNRALDNQDYREETQIAIAKKHQEWIGLAWGFYNEETHLGVVQLYVIDERFKAYYDVVHEGAAEYLKVAVENYLGK